MNDDVASVRRLIALDLGGRQIRTGCNQGSSDFKLSDYVANLTNIELIPA